MSIKKDIFNQSDVCIINPDDKRLLIPELISNMRTQIAIVKINDFIRNYKFSLNTRINYTFYKTIRILKAIFIFVYSLISFFEQPFYCNDKLSLSFLFVPERKKCSDNIALIGIYFIPGFKIYKIIELLMLLFFTFIQSISIYQRYIMKNLNTNYLICECFLFVFMIVSIIEIIVCLFINVYPLLSFLLKGLIIILLVRNLRFSWINNMKILYKTKTVFFMLFLNIMTFGLIGSFLFKDSPDFATVFDSMYSLYVLLSTCNFPDVMLSTFKTSKLSVFFFAVYIIINLYILLSLLKALFFSVYFDLYKNKIECCIEEIEKEENMIIYKENTFADLLYKLNQEIRFTKDENDKLLRFLGLESERLKFTKAFKQEIKKQRKMKSNYILLFLNTKRIEFTIIIIDFILIYILFTSFGLNQITMIFQTLWCLLFIVEFFVHYHYLGVQNLISSELLRCAFYLDNFLLFVCLISLQYYILMNQNENYLILCEYTKPLVILHSIRVFVFLNLFQEFKIIFLTLKSMRHIFIGLLINLFSFYFLFSSLSMLVTGGNILKNSFTNNQEIPNNYFHINFNDFGSSFLSCFALTMINNLQILAKSLSFHAKGTINDKMLNSYFATFYFFSTLLILNIFQTLILEMYLTLEAKKIISTKKKKKIKDTNQKIRNENKSESSSESESIKSETSSQSDDA